MLRSLALGWSCSFALLAGAMADETAKTDPPKPTQEQLEADFAQKMSGATLVGRFTVDGQGSDELPKEDRYPIAQVKKLQNDYWLFEARVQYGEQDQAIRIPLEVKWAGDTPVITVTNVLFPGLGSFTARVLIYGDQYAGTWSGGDHGGIMYGRIERAAAADEETPAEIE